MFTGLYFDGRSSKGYPCQIEFAPNALRISYAAAVSYSNNTYEGKVATWDINKIHQGNHTRTEKVSIKYGDYPYQYIEVEDPSFFESLNTAYPQKRFNASDFEFLRKVGFRGMLMVAAGFLVLLVLSYFFLLPPIAEFGASHMPISMEVQLGQKAYDQMMESASVNQPLTKQANEFWRALHVQSPYDINITVINEPIPNAFALPGGQIVVYDGIVKEMKDYDEFVALLAHEYSHARLRHGVRLLSRDFAGYIFISVLLNDASGTFAVLASNANNLKSLSFSRGLEHQADAEGCKLMQSENVSPAGMLKLFQTLKGVEGNMTIPRFINNHPLTSDRIEYIQDVMRADTIKYTDQHQDLKDIWSQMKQDQ